MPDRPSNEHIVNEKSRLYRYRLDDGNHPWTWMKYQNVVAVRVSESGNHYLRMKNGELIIVTPGWASVEIIPETPESGWTF